MSETPPFDYSKVHDSHLLDEAVSLFNNRRFHEAIEKANSIVDPKIRQPLLDRMEQIMTSAIESLENGE